MKEDRPLKAEIVNNPGGIKPVWGKTSFLLAITTATCLAALIFSLWFYSGEVASLNRETELLRNDCFVSRDPTPPASPKPATPQTRKCEPATGDINLVTEDGKYSLYRDLSRGYSFLEICDRSDSDNIRPVDRYEARVQNGKRLIITNYGSQLFYADLEKKTLKYIDDSDIPDREEYYRNDKIRLFFFGPTEDKYDFFSPDGKRLIIGASGCHDCSTTINNYVLNLETGTVTEIGRANNGIHWVNNNTVTWRETTSREWTEEEIKSGESTEFPVKFEIGEPQTTTVE